jgi:hypothetical protein
LRSRRGGGDLVSVLLIAALLVGAYFYLYQPQNGKSLVSIDLVLNYADGTSETHTLPTPILGQTVVNPATGKVLSSIAWSVKATPTWTGSAASLSVTGSSDLYVVVGSGTPSFKQGNAISYTTSTGLGTLGQATFTVKSGTLPAATLEGWSSTTGAKTLRFMIDAQAVMTMTNTALPSSQRTASAVVDFAYTVQADGITGLSISMTTTPT